METTKSLTELTAETLPFDVEFFQDLFEKVGPNQASVEPLPKILLANCPPGKVMGSLQPIEVGPVCIVGLEPIQQGDALVGGGRQYLFVRPNKDVVEFLRTRLRIVAKSSIHFKVKIRKGRALVAAIQGNDPGPEHWLAVVRADSIPDEKDLISPV